MPNRLLREGILESERIDKLGPLSELFYRRLMSVVDDFGRYTATLKVLLSRCFPTRPAWADEDLVRMSLQECELAGLLRIYSVNEHTFLEVLDFKQQVRSKSSKYPRFEDGCLASASQLTNICTLSQQDSLLAPTTSPTPTTSLSLKEKKDDSRAFAAEQDKWFEQEFWPFYWRKRDKAEANKTFRKHAGSLEQKDRIVAAVRSQSAMYLAREPEHRPHASTWLNKERYDDVEADPKTLLRPSKSDEFWSQV